MTKLSAGSALKAIAVLSAHIPGQVPEATAKAWASWLLNQNYSAEVAMTAAQAVAAEVKRVTLADFKTALQKAERTEVLNRNPKALEPGELTPKDEAWRSQAACEVASACMRLGAIDETDRAVERCYEHARGLPGEDLLKWAEDLRGELAKRDAAKRWEAAGAPEPVAELVSEVMAEKRPPVAPAADESSWEI